MYLRKLTGIRIRIRVRIIPGANRESDGLGAPFVTGLSKLGNAWLFFRVLKFIRKNIRGLY